MKYRVDIEEHDCVGVLNMGMYSHSYDFKNIDLAIQYVKDVIVRLYICDGKTVININDRTKILKQLREAENYIYKVLPEKYGLCSDEEPSAIVAEVKTPNCDIAEFRIYKRVNKK